MKERCLALLAAIALAGLVVPLRADVPEPERKPNIAKMEGHVYNPVRLDPTDERIAQLKVPDGFRIEKFAENLVNPRMLAVSEDGTVYVTRRQVGDVLMLRDTNRDGKADAVQVVAQRPDLHGIAIDRGNRRMYLAAVKDVYVADLNDDGTLGELRRIIDDLPDGGQHPNRTMGMGPDGKLYISVGSSCNACDESNPEHATMLRVEPDGRSRIIYASGLRNTVGFGWHPETGQLWGMDHNIDWLGNDVHQEELNRIEHGRNYGWPYLYEDNKPVPHREPPGDVSRETWQRMSEGMVMGYTAHAAPMQMAFYTGAAFPPEYRGDAFIVMRGSWNRNPPAGYELVRIDFQNGEPKSIQPFITGFLTETEQGHAHIGRLTGCAVSPADGSLFICDDTNGVIYRITYLERQAGG
jgi:glucose/arabinose dehydrogenase